MKKLLFSLIFIFFLYAPGESQVSDLPYLDILLAQNLQVMIGSDSPFILAGKPVDPGNYPLTLAGGDVQFQGQLLHPPFTITTSSPIQYLRLNQKLYRGGLAVIVYHGLLEVINHLTLEEYLYGVIGKEMPGSSLEALKAQAVASRTLALNAFQKGNLLHSTVTNQVYGGVLGERLTSNQAVDDTRGMVLMYQGKLVASPLFSSTCGGTTETSEAVFGKRVPYLASVKDSDSDDAHAFCNRSPYFEWQYVFDKSQLLSMLMSKGVHGDLQALVPEVTDPEGRVKTLLIKTSEGEWRLHNFEIRNAIKRPDGKILPSTWFTVEQQNQIFVFHGRGQGHGVGMCQWGAIGMADQGKDFKAILSHYYPGTDLQDMH